MGEKLKSFLSDDTTYFSLILILVSAASFGLGRESVAPAMNATETAVRIEYPELEARTEFASSDIETADDLAVVGSKNGTKYHLPDCPGAQQIAEKNLLQFASVAAAEAAGYSPAANCPGL